ncbi:biotin--[acetyl-CoA-carboxylase] ligase [Virgibacillus xinjiangensis]|uniref:Bifunctional ligase/repressor BirA n=1 Tax=Virgibacillus xinjiangensis TaxID=393090 RepID=A0ABV7CRG6_9BACI
MESTRTRLIKILSAEKDAYISGQALSEALDISRNAVWKHMKELQKDGYEIEGKPRKGYRILSFPNKLSTNTLQWGLHTKWLGRQTIHRDSTPSTQLVAHQAAREMAEHGTVVIADEQTKGRGRMDRSWYSAKEKGIWMSIILRPGIQPHLAPQLTLMSAVALADALRTHTGTTPLIKWPNDLLLSGKKTAGILTEMQAEQDQIQYVVIGIGLNVNHQEADFSGELSDKATSISLETGKTWSVIGLVQDILTSFEQSYEQYMEYGFPTIKERWEEYGFKIGQEVSVRTLKESWKAEFLGISEDGALLLRSPNGETRQMYSAEIDWFDEKGQ